MAAFAIATAGVLQRWMSFGDFAEHGSVTMLPVRDLDALLTRHLNALQTDEAPSVVCDVCKHSRSLSAQLPTSRLNGDG